MIASAELNQPAQDAEGAAPKRTYLFQSVYTLTVSTEITLPDALSWSDVKSYGVKWDTLFICLKDGRHLEFALNSVGDSLDQLEEAKHPTSMHILDPVTRAEVANSAMAN